MATKRIAKDNSAFSEVLAKAQREAEMLAITRFLQDFVSYEGTLQGFLDELPKSARDLVMEMQVSEFFSAIAPKRQRSNNSPAKPLNAPEEHKAAVLAQWGSTHEEQAKSKTTRGLAEELSAEGMNKKQVLTALKALIAEGKVRQEGEKRGASYHFAG